jgi:hypothetical protein
MAIQRLDPSIDPQSLAIFAQLAFHAIIAAGRAGDAAIAGI